MATIIAAATAAAQDSTSSDDNAAQVRIVARKLESGRIEFALQPAEADTTWGDRLLPQNRYFPPDAPTGRWLVSSPLAVETATARIVARKLANGRIEFALQQAQPDGTWGDRLLPQNRYFPPDAPTGRWLVSSLLALRLAPATDEVGSDTEEVNSYTVPEAPAALVAKAGDGQVTLNWEAGGDGGSPIRGWQYRFQTVNQQYSAWQTISGGSQVFAHTVTNLENDEPYLFEIRALNQAGPGPEISSTTVTPVGPLTVEVTPFSVDKLVEGGFRATVLFTRPVTGFDKSDITVANGWVPEFSGTGNRYEVLVEPWTVGEVVVRVPAGVAFDSFGIHNEASAPLVGNRGSGQGPGFDTWNRAEVVARTIAEFQRVEPDPEFTGKVDTCVAGTTSQQFRDSVIQRVNWYRGMAGVNPITENQQYSQQAQAAALIMSANHNLSHNPSPDWTCYTEDGVLGARNSNLSLGTHGVQAIDGQTQDSGSNNVQVGHRQWILNARVTSMGTGDIPYGSGSEESHYHRTNALYVVDRPSIWSDSFEVRQSRKFVAWPPPGYIPASTNWGRWHFTIPEEEYLSYDFSSAKVTVTDDNGTVATEIIWNDHSIVWAINGDTNSNLQDPPVDSDHCYTIRIDNVTATRWGNYNSNETIQQDPYEYVTCILKGLPTPNKPAISCQTENSMRVTWNTVSNATSYQVEHWVANGVRNTATVTGTEFIRTGVAPGSTGWSDWYWFRVRAINAEGISQWTGAYGYRCHW